MSIPDSGRIAPVTLSVLIAASAVATVTCGATKEPAGSDAAGPAGGHGADDAPTSDGANSESSDAGSMGQEEASWNPDAGSFGGDDASFSPDASSSGVEGGPLSNDDSAEAGPEVQCGDAPCPTPIFSPPGGSLAEAAQGVSITVPGLPGSTIYYTTDNTLPTRQSSVYRGPIVVQEATIVRAMSSWPCVCVDSFFATAVFTAGADAGAQD